MHLLTEPHYLGYVSSSVVSAPASAAVAAPSVYVAVLHLHQSHYIKELSSGYCSMNSWWRSPLAMSCWWRRRRGWSAESSNVTYTRRCERNVSRVRSTTHTRTRD